MRHLLLCLAAVSQKRLTQSTRLFMIVNVLCFALLPTWASDLLSVSMTTTPLNKVAFGTIVTLTATATGGTNIQYKFMSDSFVLRDFNSSNTCTWTPGALKTYNNLTVVARDLDAANPTATVTSSAVSLTTTILTNVSMTTTPVGISAYRKPVILKATATGGTNIQYKFMCDSFILRDFSSSNTCSWTPGALKTYNNLTVVARDLDAANPTATVTSSAVSLTTTILTNVSMTTTPVGISAYRKPVVLTATATGGTNIQYKFMCDSFILRDFSSSNTCTWTPGALKTYNNLTVVARDLDAVNPTATVTSSAVGLTTTVLTSVSMTTTPADTVVFKTPVTLTATAIGGVNVQYKFMSDTAVIRDFNSSNTCIWTPAMIKTYSNLTVVARDLGSVDPNIVTSPAVSLTTITTTLTSVSLTTTPTASSVFGQPVLLTAIAINGVNVQYKFVSDNINVIRDFNSSSTCTWTPAMIKTYNNLTVVARDTGGLNPNATVTSAAKSLSVIAPLPPTITSFTSNSCPIGQAITITGTNLYGATAVRFNGTAAIAFTVDSDTSITVTVPKGATNGKISVTTLGGTAVSSIDFILIPAPTIASFTPATGSAGQVVTITGNYFTGTTEVKFNNTIALTFTTDSATSITATVPNGATTGKITVSTPGGSATSVDNFTIYQPPTITSFTLSSEALGAIVTITGTNFTEATEVKFNGVAATNFTVDTDTSITVYVPDGATTGFITVTTPGGTAVSVGNFTVIPKITSFTSTFGNIGQVISIIGVNFTDATAVKFNNIAAIYTVDSASSITAVVPTGATTGKITVTTIDGTAASAANFTVNTATGTPMVWVPGGTFTMGSTDGIGRLDEKIAHQVTLSSYWMYKYEVTVAQYLEFCNATARELPAFPTGYSWADQSASWNDPEIQQHPIVNVSWYDAKAFADWAGVKLPTEAQWEYAVRGPLSHNYPWGGTATTFDLYNAWNSGKCANYYNSASQGISTWPVGSFSAGASWCGAYDLAGNAGEWCADWYGASYASTPVTNPIGPDTGNSRVIRGGSWMGGEDIFRCTSRGCSYPISGDYTLGFRCVLPLGAPSITAFTPSTGRKGTIVSIIGTNLTGATAVKFNGTTATTFFVVSSTSITAIVPSGAVTGKINVTTPGGTATSVTDFTIDNTGTPAINPTDGATMVWVPGGTFSMGGIYGVSSNEHPTRQVTLSGYWIYKYEVTVAQYRAFCNATLRPLPSFPTGYSWLGKSGWNDPALQQHPIVNVSWNDCKAYADWAGVSLPTEAQWEYAARGSLRNNYPWGGTATASDPYNGWDQTKCANYYNSYSQGISTWPVGSFPAGASWCGAQDMAGNVWQWCSDWYGNYSTTSITNPTGPEIGDCRVLRGGSWDNGYYGGYDEIRGACRYVILYPYYFFKYGGFRCAVSSTGP